MTPVVVMQPIKPELDCKNVSDAKASKGFALFRGVVDKVRTEQAARFWKADTVVAIAC